MNLGLSGKVALVTGAARGIGYSEAQTLAQEGCQLVIADLDGPAAEDAASSIRASGAVARATTCDVADEASVAALFAEIAAVEGRLDILVNNAGIGGRHLGHRIEDMALESWNLMVDVHMRGTFLCTRAAIPPMRRGGFGRIVNTSSMNVFGGGRAGNANYTAAKAGIAGFTRVVAKEVGSDAITCNAVAPGYVETDLIAGFSPQMRAAIEEQNPLGRFCKPDEVASLVAFLCSTKAAFINGAIVNLDGGRREFVWSDDRD